MPGAPRVHAALLLVVLLLFIPLVGTDAVVSMDEGAAAHQARLLATTGSWTAALPVPELAGLPNEFPLVKSDLLEDGWAPFAKHPLYPAVLAPLFSLGGGAALLLSSTFGTWVAALAAARLVRQLGSGAGVSVAALWLVGVGSPLLFDAYFLVAHSIGAAIAAWMLLMVVERRRTFLRTGLITMLAGVGVMLRTEFLLIAAAVVVADVLVTCRMRRWVTGGLSVAVAGGAVLGRLIERGWQQVIGLDASGAADVGSSRGDVASVIGDRLDAAVITLFEPSYGTDSVLRGIVMGLLCIVIVQGYLLHRRVSVRFAWVLPALGGVGSLAMVWLFDDLPIPGLVPSSPVLIVGLVMFAAHRSAWSLPLVAIMVFAAMVLLTQYEQGGGIEWGGRYFALAIPIAGALASIAWARAIEPLQYGVKVRVVLGLAGVSIALAIAATSSSRALRSSTDEGLDELAELEADLAVEQTIIVTPAFSLPRLDWNPPSGRAWVFLPLSEPTTASATIARICRSDWETLVLVAADPVEVLGGLRIDVSPDTIRPIGDLKAAIVPVANIRSSGCGAR